MKRKHDEEQEDPGGGPSKEPRIEKLGEVGLIEKITLKNFMCHPKLVVPLCTHVNFIVGNNGSGKSAIVTALVVGLGGKATATNRGNKMKSFIMTGKSTAEVEIKLRNQGPDAFKPELYGTSILVNRKFTSDGTSQYRLKSCDDKVISTKKEDLTRMLEQFNIQVDNPLAILNQDTSRNFLHSKNPQDKYKFFLKATLLEQIKEDYDQASEHKVTTTTIIKQKMENLPKLEKEVLEWQKKYKSLTAIDDLRSKVEKLRYELAWAFVIEKEKGLEPLVAEFDREVARLPRFKQKAEEAKTKLDAINKRMTEITSQLSASGEDVKQIQPRHREAKANRDEQKKITKNAQMEVRRIEGALRNSQNEKKLIVRKIKEIQSTANQDYQQEREERERKLGALEDRLASLQAQMTTTDHQVDQFRNAITKYKNDAYKFSQDGQAVQAQLDKHQRNLTAMKASQGNQLKRFGQFMPAVIQMIDEYHQRGRFRKKPIGPLGACFTLRDQKWALAIECCLTQLMTAFCCDNFDDQRTLQEIISRVNPNYKASIIVSKFKNTVYNTESKRADNSQFPSVMDLIQSDEPMVYNTLIDQRTIECVLLIEEGAMARQVMNPENRPPARATEAFTMKGDQVYSVPTFRYYSSNQTNARYLTVSVEEDIARTTQEIARLKESKDALLRQKRDLDGEIRRNQQEERKTEAQLMKLQENIHKVSMEITELKNIEDPAPADVATYEDEVRTLEQNISELEAQLGGKTVVLQEQEALQKDLNDKFQEIEAEMKSKIDAADAVKEDVGGVMNEVETCKAASKHYSSKLKEQEKHIKELQDRVDKYKAEIESDIKTAEKIHEKRIATRRSANNLNSELAQIEKQIANEERQRGDPVEITRQYKEKKEAFLKIRNEITGLKTFCKTLDNALDRRHLCYEKLKKSAAFRVKLRFLMDMALNRTLEGKMDISHAKKEICIWVQPRKAETSEGSRDLRALSGGERSFSTVCFILALWNAMDSPFRCLDEFDIYMDMVNRRISMQMMMNTAKAQDSRQFIFLTPQTMSNLGITSDRMRIFRMPNPERGQRTLEETVAQSQDEAGPSQSQT